MKPSRYNLYIPQGNGTNAVFNTLSGAIVLLDQAATRAVRSAQVAEVPPADLQSLQECNILVADDTDETHVFSYLYSKRVHSRERAAFTVVTTYACNLRCAYCYEGAGEIYDAAMDGETIKKVLWFIRHVAAISACSRLEIGLFGGEPLLNADACFTVLTEAEKWARDTGRALGSWIFTNGTLLSDDVVQRLAHFRTGVRLTLDDPRWYHDKKRVFKDGGGTYDVVLSAIAKLLAGGIDVSVRIQIANDNWMHMSELFDDLQTRGLSGTQKVKFALSSVMPMTKVCRAYAMLCLPADQLPDVYETLFDVAQERGICLAEKPIPTTQRMYCGFQNDHVFAIDPFGDVYKCISSLGQKERRIFSIGPDGIDAPTFEYYDFMSRHPSRIAKCRNCVYLPVCSGGCAALAKAKYGTYHEGDCSQHKRGIEKQINNLVRLRMQPRI